MTDFDVHIAIKPLVQVIDFGVFPALNASGTDGRAVKNAEACLRAA